MRGAVVFGWVFALPLVASVAQGAGVTTVQVGARPNVSTHGRGMPPLVEHAVRQSGTDERLVGRAPAWRTGSPVSRDELHGAYRGWMHLAGPDDRSFKVHLLPGGAVVTEANDQQLVGVTLNAGGERHLQMPAEMVRFAAALGLRNPRAASPSHVTDADRRAAKEGVAEMPGSSALLNQVYRADAIRDRRGRKGRTGPYSEREQRKLRDGREAKRALADAVEVTAYQQRRQSTTVFDGVEIEHDPIEKAYSELRIRSVKLVSATNRRTEIPAPVYTALSEGALGRLTDIVDIAPLRRRRTVLTAIAELPEWPDDATVYTVVNRAGDTRRVSFILARRGSEETRVLQSPAAR